VQRCAGGRERCESWRIWRGAELERWEKLRGLDGDPTEEAARRAERRRWRRERGRGRVRVAGRGRQGVKYMGALG
jgi:hypothetical protein